MEQTPDIEQVCQNHVWLWGVLVGSCFLFYFYDAVNNCSSCAPFLVLFLIGRTSQYLMLLAWPLVNGNLVELFQSHLCGSELFLFLIGKLAELIGLFFYFQNYSNQEVSVSSSAESDRWRVISSANIDLLLPVHLH